ncbi:prepilin peptidase [Paenibacillus antri]|uniref:Prepilin peptidase n=1 Tax=Paenibacillus antri TaxID=2582848 RepID=A0A5R9G9V4_9BACL|nr:A24 family peptidase [Paenibacillus antri]TLS50158.1 prepilin peptidase [Paenibacillus antri]
MEVKELAFAAAAAAAGVPLGALADAWARRALSRRRAPGEGRSTRGLAAAAASASCAWIGLRYGPADAEWLPAALLAVVMVAITITDMRAMLIPNAIVFPAVGLAALLRLLWHPLPLWEYAAGAAVGFGLLFAVSFLSKGGIGGGDVKLYVFVGLVCGLQATLLSLLLASFAGTAYGIVRRLSGKRGGTVPFGPFIAVGAFLSMMYAERWLERYATWLSQA